MLDEQGKTFLNWLESLREGRCVNEAGAALARVVEGVHETAGPGSVTLTLRVALNKDNTEVVETVDVVTSKTPEERKDAWYFGPGGQLLRHRPRDTRPGLFDEPGGIEAEPDPADVVDTGPSDEDYGPPADEDDPD